MPKRGKRASGQSAKKKPLREDDLASAPGVDVLPNGNVRRQVTAPPMSSRFLGVNHWLSTVPDSDDGRYTQQQYNLLHEAATETRWGLVVPPGASLPPNVQPAQDSWIEYAADSTQAIVDTEIAPPFVDTARDELDANYNRVAGESEIKRDTRGL